MPRTPEQALAWAKGQHDDRGTEWHNMCQMFVRSCYAVGGYFPSATAAWYGANTRHRQRDGDRVPRGVPYFWTGGSQGFGHVVISAGGGLCWSTDVQRYGGVDLVRIDEITQRWHQTPQGWTEDINEVRVWRPPAPPKTLKIDVSELHRAYEHDRKRPTGGKTPGASDDVKRFELVLANAGYMDSRFVDGSYGTRTIAGMAMFQRRHKMKGDGAPTSASVHRLVERRYKVVG